MRAFTFKICIATTFLVGTTAHAKGIDCDRSFDASAPYPTEVALLHEPPRGWTFRQSPQRLPLYYFDDDRPNESTCYDGCATQWIPLPAPHDAKPVGHWSIVKRRDDKLQWAYRARPLYVRIHDSPQAPSGDRVDGKWHLLPFCP